MFNPDTHATEAPPAERPVGRRRVRSAEQIRKNEAMRLKLLGAAARIIGKYGYAGCTIARVAARAKIAHGTFYLYFASQRELFDQLLPTLGARMLDTIRAAIHGIDDVIEMERVGFEANIAYLIKHPYMFRVMTEAQLHAPAAFKEHHDSIAASYTRSLRARLSPDLYRDEEIPLLATMLVGMRTQLLLRYGMGDNGVVPPPEGMIETYVKFVSQGLRQR